MLSELLRRGSTEHAVSGSDELGARILVLDALESDERSAT
jgi:hypothetical protein